MRNKNGVSLVEFLVAIIIAAVMLLTVGTISTLSLKASRKARKQAEIYSDLSYGLKLLSVRLRESYHIVETTRSNWTGNVLEMTDDETDAVRVFGIRTSNNAFAYMPDDESTDIEEIFIPDPGDPLNLSFNVTADQSAVEVTIGGEKDGIPFELKQTVMKRNES